jgi:hypothetical protein
MQMLRLEYCVSMPAWAKKFQQKKKLGMVVHATISAKAGSLKWKD